MPLPKHAFPVLLVITLIFACSSSDKPAASVARPDASGGDGSQPADLAAISADVVTPPVPDVGAQGDAGGFNALVPAGLDLRQEDEGRSDAPVAGAPDARPAGDVNRADGVANDAGTADVGPRTDASSSGRGDGPVETASPPDLADGGDSKISPDTSRPDVQVPDVTIRPSPDGLPPLQTCATEPLRTTGTIHYVCDCQTGASTHCVPGDDNNPGTSPETPLQTFSKAASTFAKMPAGDTVALCRGGLWITGGGGFSNPNCTKDDTCDFRDYAAPWGDGSEPLPAIWAASGTNGKTLLTFTHVPQHQEGFRVFNLDLHGSLTDTALFFWNETTDVDLCNLSMDGFKNSVNMSGGDQPDFGTPANIVLRNSRITNNADIGYIAVCDHCAIQDSYFDNNGAGSTTTHSVYFASQEWNVDGTIVVHETAGMRLSRNEIHHSNVPCKGSPVVVHGRHRDVVIEDNLVDAVTSTDACWGPGVGCGAYPYGCWFRNTIIRGNIIKGLGNTGTENDNCTGCLVENNLIIIDKSGNGITMGGTRPRPAGDSGYTRSDGQLDDATDKAVVRNNTIYFTATATSGRGISVPSGAGHTIANNAIYFAVTTAGASDNLCYGLPSSPASAMVAVDRNICRIPSNGHWASAPGSGAMTLAAWQTLSGFDSRSKQTDPMFTNAPTDFTPAATSPLLNAADPLNSPTADLNRKIRDVQPDIGAFER